MFSLGIHDKVYFSSPSFVISLCLVCVSVSSPFFCFVFVFIYLSVYLFRLYLFIIILKSPLLLRPLFVSLYIHLSIIIIIFFFFGGGVGRQFLFFLPSPFLFFHHLYLNPLPLSLLFSRISTLYSYPFP